MGYALRDIDFYTAKTPFGRPDVRRDVIGANKINIRKGLNL